MQLKCNEYVSMTIRNCDWENTKVLHNKYLGTYVSAEIWIDMHTCWASLVALVVKSPPAKARHMKDAGLTPGLGRLPGGGNGNPLQYSCIRNPMDRGPWWATVQRVASLTWLSISAWYVHIYINSCCWKSCPWTTGLQAPHPSLSFRIDWFNPAPQFKSISSSVLSLLYGPTLTPIHDYWKNHSFDDMDLCQQSDVSAL